MSSSSTSTILNFVPFSSLNLRNIWNKINATLPLTHPSSAQSYIITEHRHTQENITTHNLAWLSLAFSRHMHHIVYTILKRSLGPFYFWQRVFKELQAILFDRLPQLRRQKWVEYRFRVLKKMWFFILDSIVDRNCAACSRGICVTSPFPSCQLLLST